MANRYITTPVYYVNARPHIGHAYTTVMADILARYFKAKGEDVFFLTGTDEHGAKNAQAAERVKKTPKQYVNELASEFRIAWQGLNIDYSQFIRTSDPKHEKVVVDFVQKLKNAGFVDKRRYSGLYCIACERYLTPKELESGLCPDHKTKPVLQTEENYFFALSRFQEKLIRTIERDELLITPATRRNEVLGKLRAGLEDVSISRANVVWGIPFPDDPSQTIYVWVDALINYYSATEMYDSLGGWAEHPADIHLIGKDILWFHAVIWPAMLLALKLPLPKTIATHGFFTIGGEKMSKTRGNVLDPLELVEKYGVDTIRYALVSAFPFGTDGDFSEEIIKQKYESELANELGNLLQRVLVMMKKYNLCSLAKKWQGAKRNKVSSKSRKELLAVGEDIEKYRFDPALSAIWDIVRQGNEAIERAKPWELAKNNKAKLEDVISNEYERLLLIARLIKPFMPATSSAMEEQLQSCVPEPLFPKIDR
ncbi:MAG TPA: methionine--tRNA ligase [bacterium]|nr:methionine--tRNA ligase [bacterium]